MVLYGGFNETHEVAFAKNSTYRVLEGNGVLVKTMSGALVVNWVVTPSRKVLQVGNDFYIYLLGEDGFPNA